MIVLIAEYYTKEGKDDAVAATLREMSAYCNSDAGAGLRPLRRQPLDRGPAPLPPLRAVLRSGRLEAHTQTDMFKEKVLGTAVPMLESRERSFWEMVE